MTDHGEQPPPETLDGRLTPWGHVTHARVYFADTDFSGVVYHARYLEFLERGRSDFLRLQGVRHAELAEGIGGERGAWVVRRMELLFRAPARIEEVLRIETRTERMSGARVFMDQRIRRGGQTLIEAKVELATIGADGRPRRFPKAWVDAFMPAGGSEEANR